MIEAVDRKEAVPPQKAGKREQGHHMVVRAMRWAIEKILGLRERRTLRESIETVLVGESVADDEFGSQERHMLMNVLNFADKRIDDVMVPRADIVALEISAGLEDLLDLMQEKSHSRMPIYRDTLDEPVGMVHIKDVLSWMAGHPNDVKSFDLRTIRRPVLFVPPSMPARDLLLKMQSSRIHMALVVDEYGGTDGLVSIEDLIEEIVGDIEDEHDVTERASLVKLDDGSIDALARAPIEDLEEVLGVTLVDPDADDDADTLGGLVFSLVGRVPQRGELILHPVGIEFEILDADPRRIKRLRIQRAAAATRKGPKEGPAAASQTIEPARVDDRA